MLRLPINPSLAHLGWFLLLYGYVFFTCYYFLPSFLWRFLAFTIVAYLAGRHYDRWVSLSYPLAVRCCEKHPGANVWRIARTDGHSQIARCRGDSVVLNHLVLLRFDARYPRQVISVALARFDYSEQDWRALQRYLRLGFHAERMEQSH